MCVCMYICILFAFSPSTTHDNCQATGPGARFAGPLDGKTKNTQDNTKAGKQMPSAQTKTRFGGRPHNIGTPNTSTDKEKPTEHHSLQCF